MSSEVIANAAVATTAGEVAFWQELWYRKKMSKHAVHAVHAYNSVSPQYLRPCATIMRLTVLTWCIGTHQQTDCYNQTDCWDAKIEPTRPQSLIRKTEGNKDIKRS